MRETVGVRSHKPDESTLSLYRQLVSSLGSDRVVIVADEVTTKPAEWPHGVAVIRISPEMLSTHGLRFDIPDTGWRCRDYAHLAMSAELESDHTWLVESDVAFARIAPRTFLEMFENDPADYIAYGISPAKNWEWCSTLIERGFAGTEWRSFFPLTRASRAAVEAAVQLRLDTQWTATTVMHPNDEIVMATAVIDYGLSWTSLEDVAPEMFGHYKYGQRRSLRALSFWRRGPQIFHPVGRRASKRIVTYRNT
jgi:hypothetical protein